MLFLPKEVETVITTLQGAGYSPYLVGGCVREMLRGKKQEFASLQTLSVTRANTNTIHFVRRASTTPDSELQTRMKEYSLRVRNSMVLTANAGSTVVDSGMRRLMTFEGEQGDMSPSKLEDVQQHVEPEYVRPAETYGDVLDEFMRKLELPAVPVLLGMVLGNMTETNFRRALLISDGSPRIFVSSVYCWIFIALIVVVILGILRGKMKEAKNTKAEQ